MRSLNWKKLLSFLQLKNTQIASNPRPRSGRKQLGVTAHNFFQYFVSRNNDMFGYWALGILRRHAVDSGSSNVEIDVLNATIEPCNVTYEKYLRVWRSRLIEQLVAQSIPLDWVQSACVKLDFGEQPIDADELIRDSRNFLGSPAICTVEIKNDHGGLRQFRRQIFCWPHDPEKEHKSIRSR